MKAQRVYVWLILCVLSKACVGHGFPGGDGWEWMSGAAQLDGAEFMDFASPLVQMSANAYRYPGTLRSIPGWSLSTQIAPLHPSQAQGGAQALVFEELDDAHRVILAFRGTQFSSSLDSVADLCADKILWEGLDFGSLPSECSVFDPHTLDYFSQALNYTLQVIDLYPSTPILLTGHSLGAGLAVLVAGALMSHAHVHTLPVIGFGAPATRKALLDRGISVESLEIGKVMVVGHEWDAIMRTQMEGQVGLLCFYPQTEPSSCKACIPSTSSLLFHEGLTSLAHGDVQSELIHGHVNVKPGDLGPFPPGDCMDCFYSTHYLKKLIAVVDLGIRPKCEQARSDVSLTKLDIM